MKSNKMRVWNRKKKIQKSIVGIFLITCAALCFHALHIQAEEQAEGYVEGNETEDEISTFALPESDTITVKHIKYNKFFYQNDITSTAEYPTLNMRIKYLGTDKEHPDSEERMRYVYSMSVHKSMPVSTLDVHFSGWTDKKINYALYHGAAYYGEACRNAAYATGDWRQDYFVTQMVIHILNGEFTLEAFGNSLARESLATQAEKDLVYDRVVKMLQDANDEAKYSGFSEEGWADMSGGSFVLNNDARYWTYANDYYFTKGYFSGTALSPQGYDISPQILEYRITLPEGVLAYPKEEGISSEFKLQIAEETYKEMQLLGYEIPVTVEAGYSRYWGGKIFEPENSFYQTVCMLAEIPENETVYASNSSAFYVAQASFPRNLTIQAKIPAEEVNWAHGNPIFFFMIWGRDKEDWLQAYSTFVEFRKEDVVGQSGAYYVAETTLQDIPSGTYTIQEMCTLRYILTDAEALSDNAQVRKSEAEVINNVGKVDAEIEIDLTLKDAYISFTNRKVKHDKYSDNAIVKNSFVIGEIPS